MQFLNKKNVRIFFILNIFIIFSISIFYNKNPLHLSKAIAKNNTYSKQMIIPQQFSPSKLENSAIYFNEGINKVKTTLIPELQLPLEKFIRRYKRQISAIVVIDIKTSKIIALVQGKAPVEWGSTTHSALNDNFLAASLFKTVTATAALELTDIHATQNIGLQGGCQKIRKNGIWLKDQITNKYNRMSLTKAYANSCNSFFAKLVINQLGLSNINRFAFKYGWKQKINADFLIKPSTYVPPSIHSNTFTIGEFAAGFGHVQLSPIHAAYMMNIIANKGVITPLQLFSNTKRKLLNNRIFSEKTAKNLLKIMKNTNINGSASYAFRRRRYRSLKKIVGGKTGTLSGRALGGVNSWYAGLMPIDSPEIAVAAVTVLKDKWLLKGANMAAETFRVYNNYKKKLHKGK